MIMKSFFHLSFLLTIQILHVGALRRGCTKSKQTYSCSLTKPGFIIHPTSNNSFMQFKLSWKKKRNTLYAYEDDTSFKEPEELGSNFGRKKYWNEFYENEKEFSWYSPWRDIAPFFQELVPAVKSIKDDVEGNFPRILLPGIGNDSSMVEMYDDGYTHLTAFDYAQAGMDNAHQFFGKERLLEDGGGRKNRIDNTQSHEIHEHGVDLLVADARELPFQSNTFDAVLEKGTLDAIYLSGGKDKELASKYLDMAVGELSRVVCSGGIVFSITAACTDAVEAAFQSRNNEFETLRDGSFFMTEDGYASNNIDATVFAWQRK